MKFILVYYYVDQDRTFKPTWINAAHILRIEKELHVQRVEARIFLTTGEVLRVSESTEFILARMTSEPQETKSPAP